MVTLEMRDDCARINEQWPPLADAFREIHRFILKAVDGNAAAANALFQRYLNGELPDELLQISRRWVQEEQAVRPVERRRLRLAGEWRRGRPNLLVGGGGAAESALDVGERS
jgi:hypothetical protein